MKAAMTSLLSGREEDICWYRLTPKIESDINRTSHHFAGGHTLLGNPFRMGISSDDIHDLLGNPFRMETIFTNFYGVKTLISSDLLLL